MFSPIFFSYAALHLLVVIWMVRLLRRGFNVAAACIAFISLALVYDNFMIGFGAQIGAGWLLETLSLPRFALHAGFTPLIMLAAWEIGRAAGIPWTENKLLRGGLWIVMLSLSAYGISLDLVGLKLQTACLGDTLRYTSSTPPAQFCFPGQTSLPGHGPPIPSIASTVVALVMGLCLWRDYSFKGLAGAAAVMFVAAGAPQSELGTLPGNAGEVILMTGLALGAWTFSSKTGYRPEARAT